MINVEGDFNPTCTGVTFKSTKWKVPLASLKAMQIGQNAKKGDLARLEIFFDLAELNRIMMGTYGAKKPQKKDQRKLKFVDLRTLRDFVFHLKRIYHLHRRSKVAREVGMVREKL